MRAEWRNIGNIRYMSINQYNRKVSKMDKKFFCFFIEFNQDIKFIEVLLWAVILSGLILLMDIYDIPSSVINEIPKEAMIIFISLLLVTLLLAFYNGHLWDLCKFPQRNIIDKVNLCAVFGCVICVFVWGFWINQYAYKWVMSSILFVLSVSTFIGRQLYIKKNKQMNVAQNNVYDLKDIYDGKVMRNLQTPILVFEKDVEYDLLSREGIINQLYRSIAACKFDSAFVIGLEGGWGSGKTTIFNNAKAKLRKNKDIIIIDKFDPWMYGTQDALLVAMYDNILRETGVKYNIYHERRMIKSFRNMIVDNYNAGGIIQSLFFPQYGDYEETNEIIERLRKYMERLNKRIVFFIDNMDRVEGDKIIFLLRLIGTVFDLPNIIYVLSYDRSRLNDILGDTIKINPKYIEKIINQEIKVPLPQNEKLKEVYDACIKNILKSYEVNELSEFDILIKIILDNVKNLRMFKRMINSAFVSTFFQDNILYKRDLLGMEVIRFLQPKLYYKINENKAFFISHDRIINQQYNYEHFDKKKFNSRGKIFFEELFAEYGAFKILLAQMFPYVERFANGSELQSEYFGSDTEYKHISKNARICSGKYFDLYFSYGSNEYLEIGKEISDMIGEIIQSKNNSWIYECMCSQIVNIPGGAQREWFERLENYLDLIPTDKKIILVKSIFDCLNKINSSRVSVGLDTQTRALLCIELLLEETEINAMQEFVESIADEYGKLYMIDQIIYWFQSTRSQHTDDVKIRENILKEKFSEMCEKVIQEEINIYVDPYYVQYNVWGLMRYLKIKENREEIVHAYIAKIINEETIFRVMGDMLSQSIGNGYGYKIDKDNFKLFFEDESILDSLLKKVKPKTQSEEFILEVYEKFKGDETNAWGDKQIISKTEVLLEL